MARIAKRKKWSIARNLYQLPPIACGSPPRKRRMPADPIHPFAPDVKRRLTGHPAETLLPTGAVRAVRRKPRHPESATAPNHFGSTRPVVSLRPPIRTNPIESRATLPGRNGRAHRVACAEASRAGIEFVSGRPFKPSRFLAVFAFLAFAAPAWTQDISWRVERFDPAVAKGQPVADLYLPMPCGGAMAFQRVVVPADEISPAVSIQGHFDPAHLRGGYNGGENPAATYFYIARYEMTVDQAAALRGSCPPSEPLPEGILPALGLSWLDAEELGRLHTDWLQDNAPLKLPRERDASGFLRMPTEAEWEYAARGGDALGPAAFAAPAYPMEGGIDAHAWHQGVARGSARQIGSRDANPLGLHDIYGNAEELMLEPFRIDDAVRGPGQEYMLITRGGHYLSPPEDLNSEKRQLWPLLRATDGRASAEDTFGLRLVLSTRLALDEAFVAELADSWAAAESANPDADAGTDLGRLQGLLQAEREALASLRDELEAMQAKLAEAEAGRERPESGNPGGFAYAILLALSILVAVLLLRPRRPVEIRLPRAPAAQPGTELLLSATHPGQNRTRLTEGDVVEGIVTNFGGSCAFVDLGGIDGVMHVSEMGEDKIKSPSEALSAGDAVKVRIIEIDPASRHVSLGLEGMPPVDSRSGTAAKKGISRQTGSRAAATAGSRNGGRSGG